MPQNSNIIDATGHATEVVKVVRQKVPGSLKTASGEIEGEKSMWSDRAEIGEKVAKELLARLL